MYVGAPVARHMAMARSTAIDSDATGRLSAKCSIAVCARAVRTAVQHSMVARSSQWINVMPPACPVARMMWAKSRAPASNDGKHMKIFTLDWPAATAGVTSARICAVGVRMTAWKNTSAIACCATSTDSARTRSAIVSHGRTYDMLPTVVIPPASAASEPLV